MTSAENLGGGPGEPSGAGWDLEISAGVGPEEVQRFVAGLAVALAERCLAAGLEVVGRRVDGDDGTPRSIALRLRGGSPEVDAAAPVRLAALLGTHELFDDARRGRSGRHRGHRKRWFAAVRLHRALAPATHEVPALDPAEVELRCDRAGGPGGQHVNTTSTAVRARHLPTQITVRVAEGRSQHHNRSLALERLAALVAEGEARDRDRDLARRRGLHYRLVRGEAVARWRWSDTRRRILEEVPR